MNEILQFDDFARDAEEVRNAVISGEFGTQEGPDGADYTGISTYQVPQWINQISECLKKPIVPKISCFRMNLAGELPHSWVHSDGICADFASVLYLNPPAQCSGGTAFWKHTKLGITSLPSRDFLNDAGIEADEFYKQMDRDWKELSLWKQEYMVPMQWNRFITYSTSLFHSRFPFEGFGKGPQDGRLIWICFYDLAGKN